MQKIFRKSAAIDFQKLNPEWDKIKLFYKIRNKFIHHSGTISQEDNDYKVIKALEYKELIDDPGLITIEMVGLDYEIKLRKELNTVLLETITSFFKKLLNDNMTIQYVADYI